MDTWTDRVEVFLHNFWGAIGAAVAGGLLYLLRLIFTNQKQINVLVQEQKHREEMREAEREAAHDAFARIHRELSDIHGDVRMLYSREMAKDRIEEEDQ